MDTVVWAGGKPDNCETCSFVGRKPNPLDKEFYDAKTRMGPWGCICHECFTNGPGLNKLGTGWGQKYELQTEGKYLGKFVKVAG